MSDNGNLPDPGKKEPSAVVKIAVFAFVFVVFFVLAMKFALSLF